jgi:Zn-dependent protease/CBS domain-containing protein
VRVGSLFGIPFFIDASWFLILGLVTWTYGSDMQARFADWSGPLPWVYGLVAALLLFGSVLLHELGHSFAALAQGIPVRSISLFLFGGVARIERESHSPWGALVIALAGPLVSLGLWGLFSGLERLALPTGLATLVSLLATINLALAIFNMLPGLPLDGGNVLKSLVWGITGNQYRGIRIAAWAGYGVAALLAAMGFFVVGGFNGLWLGVIAWFVFSNAGAYGRYAKVQERLSGLTAAEAAVRAEPSVSVHATLRTFADFYALVSPQATFLVTDEAGRLVGRIDRRPLGRYAPQDWSEIPVGAVMDSIDESETVAPSQRLDEVFERLQSKRLMRLPVLLPNGLLVGQVRLSDIERLLFRGDRLRLV